MEENSAEKNIIKAYEDAWLNYINFKGRTSRYDFWSFHLVNIIIGIILAIVPFVGSILGNLYNLAVLIPSITICVRRFHDVDKSALKWILLPLVVIIIIGATVQPLAGLLVLIYFICTMVVFCKKGNVENNEYGEAIIETENQIKKSKYMIILLVGSLAFVMLCSFIFGIASGYHKAMSKYEQQNAINNSINNQTPAPFKKKSNSF